MFRIVLVSLSLKNYQLKFFFFFSKSIIGNCLKWVYLTALPGYFALPCNSSGHTLHYLKISYNNVKWCTLSYMINETIVVHTFLFQAGCRRHRTGLNRPLWPCTYSTQNWMLKYWKYNTCIIKYIEKQNIQKKQTCTFNIMSYLSENSWWIAFRMLYFN